MDFTWLWTVLKERKSSGRSRARTGRCRGARRTVSSRSLSVRAAPARRAAVAAREPRGQHARRRGSRPASCLGLAEERRARARGRRRRPTPCASAIRPSARSSGWPHRRRRKTPCSSYGSASSRRPWAASATPCAVCTSPTSRASSRPVLARLVDGLGRRAAAARRGGRACPRSARGRRSRRCRRSTGRPAGASAAVSVSQRSASSRSPLQ